MSCLDQTVTHAFRKAMRGHCANATIVSAEADGQRYGMLATAVMSISLEPPLLAVSINHGASIHDPINATGYFCINILSRAGLKVAEGFARTNGDDRFAYGPWIQHPLAEDGSLAVPCLADAQAAILCRVRDRHVAGTHTIFVGEVLAVRHGGPYDPLAYCDGKYGAFAPIG